MSCVRIQAVRNPAITVDQLDLAFSVIAPTHLRMSPTPKMTSAPSRKDRRSYAVRFDHITLAGT